MRGLGTYGPPNSTYLQRDFDPEPKLGSSMVRHVMDWTLVHYHKCQ